MKALINKRCLDPKRVPLSSQLPPPPPPPPHSSSTNLMATSTMSYGIPLTPTVMTTGQQFFWGHPSTPLDMTQDARRGEINYYFITQL